MARLKKKPRTLGQALTMLRDKSTLEQISKQSADLGFGTLHASNLSHMERGQVSDFRLSSLVSLASVYRVPLDYLVRLWEKDMKRGKKKPRRKSGTPTIGPLLTQGRYSEALDYLEREQPNNEKKIRVHRLRLGRIALLAWQRGRAQGFLRAALPKVEPDVDAGLGEIALMAALQSSQGSTLFARVLCAYAAKHLKTCADHQLLTPMVRPMLVSAQARLALDDWSDSEKRPRMLRSAMGKLNKTLKPLRPKSFLGQLEIMPLKMLRCEVSAALNQKQLEHHLEDLEQKALQADHLAGMAFAELIRGEVALQSDQTEQAWRHLRRVARDRENLPVDLRFRAEYSLVLAAFRLKHPDLIEWQQRLAQTGAILGNSGLRQVAVWRASGQGSMGVGSAREMDKADRTSMKGKMDIPFSKPQSQNTGSRFGQYLRELRADRSARWVSERAQWLGGFAVAHTAISRLETGQVKDPRISTVLALSRVYGASLQSIVDTWSLDRKQTPTTLLDNYKAQMKRALELKAQTKLEQVATAFEGAESLAKTQEQWIKARLGRAKIFTLLRALGESNRLFEDASRHLEPEMDPILKVETLGNMVTLFSEQGQSVLIPVFLEAATQALKNVPRTHPNWDLHYSFLLWGQFVFLSRNTYEATYTERFAEAYRLIEKITQFTLASKHLKNTYYPYVYQAHYAVLLSKVGKTKAALANLKNARETLLAQGAGHYATFYLIFEGQIYLREGQLEKAEVLYQKAYDGFSDQFSAFRFFAAFHLTMTQRALGRKTNMTDQQELHRLWLLVGPSSPRESEYTIYQKHLDNPKRSLWQLYQELHYERLKS